MGYYNYEFLRVEFEDLWNLFYDTEQNLEVVRSSNTAIIKMRQIVETISKKIVHFEGLEKDANRLYLEGKIKLLDERKLLSQQTVDLFHKIRLWGNKGLHENKESTEIASNCFRKLFEPVCWFTLKYGNESYDDFLHTIQDLQHKHIFQQYLLEQQNTALSSFFMKKKFEGSSINPFELEIEDHPDSIQVNLFKKFGFETDDEFKKRIESLPPLKIGEALLDFSNSRLLYDDEYFLFACQTRIHPSIVIPSFSLCFIKTKFIKDQRSSIRCSIETKMKVYDDTVFSDLSTLTMSIDQEKIPIQCIILEQLSWETNLKFAERINSLPLLHVGFIHLNQSDYDLHTQAFPVQMNYFKWTHGVEKLQNGFLRIDRQLAKKVFNTGAIQPVFAQFVIDKKLSLVNYQIKLGLEDDLQTFHILSECPTPIAHNKTREEKTEIRSLSESGEKAYKEGNYQQAYTCFHEAALAGQAVSRFWLGKMLLDGTGIKKNYKQAIKWLKKAAKQGNEGAKTTLASMYISGKGVTRNYEHAFRLMKTLKK